MSVTASETRGKLLAACAKAQAEIGAAEKSGKNPHLKNRYATLQDIWDAIREPLTKYELDITQWPETVEGGVAVTTVLGHSSGEWMSSTLVMPLAGNANAQAVGSALTYARRYMLAAVAGVAPEDDDGNEAAKNAPKNEKQQAKEPAPKQETKPSPTATRSVENSECRKLWAAYVIEANKHGRQPSELAEFLADALGKPVADVAANEAKWNQMGDKHWAAAARLIMQAKTDLAVPPEREPGEDDAGADEYFEDQEAGAA